MHEWTASSHSARFLVKLVRRSGADLSNFVRLPGLAPQDLRDDLLRVPTSSLIALWEQLTVDGRGSAVALDAMETAGLGTFGPWDYLCTSGPDFRSSFRTALEYMALVGDADNRIHGFEDGGHFVIQQSVSPDLPEIAETVDLSALSLFLRRAREATHRPVVPLRIALSHRPPVRHSRLVEHFGTPHLEFDAPVNAMTFRLDDFTAPLPATRPGLDQILRRHADLRLASSKPLLTWLDRFRHALQAALEEDTASLNGVARRLSTSPRTLQRHLAEQGTSWREELASARDQRALSLLRETDLPFKTIATRLGYSDTRTLRRSVNRWHGRAPSELRAAAPRKP